MKINLIVEISHDDGDFHKINGQALIDGVTHDINCRFRVLDGFWALDQWNDRAIDWDYVQVVAPKSPQSDKHDQASIVNALAQLAFGAVPASKPNPDLPAPAPMPLIDPAASH